jgi:leucyl-tRNA synthetase
VLFDKNNNISIIKDLPVKLPETDNIKVSGDGRSPLANITDWLNVNINGENFVRDTNTMPQSAGSS